MARKREQSTKPASSESSQLTELPGETWEDIFFLEPSPVYNPKKMTGSDWDAILGRTRSKGEPEQ